MKPEQMLKKTLGDWKAITGIDYCLLSPDNEILLHTGTNPLPDEEILEAFRADKAPRLSDDACHIYRVSPGGEVYLLILWGEAGCAAMIGQLAVCQVESLLYTLARKNDKNSFLQELLQNRYEPGEMLQMARKLHINPSVRRAVFLFETQALPGQAVLPAIRNAAGNRSRDFYLTLEGNQILLIRELSGKESLEELEGFAFMLVDMLNTEVMTDARAAIGNPADDLGSLQIALREAQTAMEVGRIFSADKKVTSYSRLGIGRLIYQLPIGICEMFLNESFDKAPLDSLDEETLITIRTFFENNLNFSETSRQLYIHRNTLAYRFEKLQKKFGLDIRTFEDAMTFRLAMMVNDYVKYRKENR